MNKKIIIYSNSTENLEEINNHLNRKDFADGKDQVFVLRENEFSHISTKLEIMTHQSAKEKVEDEQPNSEICVDEFEEINANEHFLEGYIRRSFSISKHNILRIENVVNQLSEPGKEVTQDDVVNDLLDSKFTEAGH